MKYSNKKVVFVNGPPSVGKDTAVLAMQGYVSLHASWMKSRHNKIAIPIKEAVHKRFGIFYTPEFYERVENRHLKDIPCGEFFGDSPRQAYIREAAMVRAAYGPDFYGWMAKREMVKAEHCAIHFFSDCRHPEELAVIIDWVTPENVLVVELSAKGKTWEGDNTNVHVGDRLQQMYPKIKVVKLENDIGDVADRELFRMYCMGIIKNWLKIEENK